MLTVTERLLTDGSVSLRENSPTDSEMLYRGRMAPLSRSMFLNTEVIPYEAHESMIQKYFRADTKDCWFVIESAQKPVGTIALYNFEDHGRRSEWGRFVIAPESRGLGFGRRALRLFMEYAKTSGRSLHSEVLSTNVVPLHLYRDLGFVEKAVREDGGRSFVELSVDLMSGGAYHCTHDHRSHLIPRNGAALAIRTPAATRPESQLRHLLYKLEKWIGGGNVGEGGCRRIRERRKIVRKHPPGDHEYRHLSLCYRLIRAIERRRRLAACCDS